VGVGAGAGVLSSILGGIEAEAQGVTPRRIVFVYAGDGYLTSKREPTDLLDADGRPPGGKSPPTLQDKPLGQVPGIMEPLAKHKSSLAILTDLRNAVVGQGHWMSYAALSGMSLIGSAPAGITIDRFIAERAAASDPIPHLPLAVVKRAEEQNVRAITAAGEYRPITMRADPADVYRLLFGATASDRNASLRSRRVLDLLAPQVKAAQARLAGDERGKLGEYLAAIETLQRQQTLIERVRSAGTCRAPELVPPATMEGRMEAMFGLAAAALICRLTRVVTVSLNTEMNFDATYRGLGYTLDLHSMGHGQKDPKHGDDAAIHAFHAGLIAKLVDTLASVPEGNGTMFDNTVIVWANDNGIAHHSGPETPFYVTLVGNAGGKLRTGGRYLRFPAQGRPGHRRLVDLYTTLANAMGVDVQHFQPKSMEPMTGAISELRA
jgi:hypothetical protein